MFYLVCNKQGMLFWKMHFNAGNACLNGMWQLGLSLLRYLQGKFCDVILYDICTLFGSQSTLCLIISEKLSTFTVIYHKSGTLGLD